MNEREQRLIANISKSMAMMCVRNRMLEDIHDGIDGNPAFATLMRITRALGMQVCITL